MIILSLLKVFFFITLVCSQELIKLKNPNTANLIFDGIGGLSGGGATSKLLVSYEEKYSSQIYDYLFKPNFGASLHMLKVEIGGDSQSTEGTEASHMHNKDDLNCFRGYEWDIIKAAKTRNPNITLYALPWGFPGWVGDFTGNPYHNVTQLATYIINWLKCARDHHKYYFDYIGIWNEKPYNVKYIKTLRKMLNQNSFNKTKIIASDNKWEITGEVLKDPELARSIYALGVHYPGTVASKAAHQTQKPLWSSEDYSTDNSAKGPGCWARILNQNFVNGNMTNTISWNLIAAYYAQLPYPKCGLMNAMEPWSGNYEVADTIWVTAHTTQFTAPGGEWFYYPTKDGGSGHLKLGGSYVSLVRFVHGKPNQLTVILETMTHEFSICIRPSLPPYTVKDQNVTIVIPKEFQKMKFYLWRTRLNSKLDSDKFKFVGIVKSDKNGHINISMPINNLVTLSTVSTGHKGQYPKPPNSKPFPVQFTDNYDNYTVYSEPNYLTPQTGSFEVGYLKGYKSKVLIQTVINKPIEWCLNLLMKNCTMAVLGNYKNSNTYVSVSAMIPKNSSVDSLMVAGRVNQGGCTVPLTGGIFYWLNVKTNSFTISTDLLKKKIEYNASLVLKYDTWYTMTLIIQESCAWFYLDNKLIAELRNAYRIAPPLGFTAIGTYNYGTAYYDDFVLKQL